MYRNFLKRLIDFFIVLSALLIIWPILLIIIIFLHFANKGAGVFFTQARPGKNAQIFKAIKFKTMTDERDAEGNLFIIRKSKFPWFPERSVQFSGKRTKRSVQKKGCTQHL